MADENEQSRDYLKDVVAYWTEDIPRWVFQNGEDHLYVFEITPNEGRVSCVRKKTGGVFTSCDRKNTNREELFWGIYDKIRCLIS